MKERTIPTDFDCGSIKRADQRLRLRYYGLKTKIFLLEPRHYLIQLLNCQEQLKQLRQVFDHEIRMMGDWVTLAVEAPAQYLAEIPPLEDSGTFGEGISLTEDMLKTLLISRFPRIPCSGPASSGAGPAAEWREEHHGCEIIPPGVAGNTPAPAEFNFAVFGADAVLYLRGDDALGHGQHGPHQ